MNIQKYAKNGPGPAGYDKFNYCINCELRLPLNTLSCPECNYRVRYRPRASKARRRLEKLGMIKRY